MGANFSRYFVESAGNTITAANYNGEFDNILTNLTPAGIDDMSGNTTAYRDTVDPGESGSESLPTSLEGEILRLRKLIVEITGKTYWYESPATNLGAATIGPGSSTDNAVVRFDGTGGKTFQNSGVIVDDSNNVTGVAALSASGAITISGTSGHSVTSQFADEVGDEMTSTGANAVAEARTRTTGTTVGVGGVAISASSGASVSTTSGTYSDINNLSVTITTSGRPVMLMVIPGDTANAPTIGGADASTSYNVSYRWRRDSTTVAVISPILILTGSGTTNMINYDGPARFTTIDTPTAGTYTYKLQFAATSSTAHASYCKIVAYEL